MKLSVTQLGNFTALVPVLVILASAFDIKITESELTELVAGIVAVVGVLTSIYGRYRQGDVSLLGVKTSQEDLR